MGKSYRDCVCAVIRRAQDSKVLVCHRIGCQPDTGWQFPQGGVNPEAPLIDELKRELREEIGTDKVEVVRISTGTYCYDFPASARSSRPDYDGQRQRWILAMLTGEDSMIQFSHIPAEFDAFAWIEPVEALERIVDFKKNVYLKALSDFGLLG